MADKSPEGLIKRKASSLQYENQQKAYRLQIQKYKVFCSGKLFFRISIALYAYRKEKEKRFRGFGTKKAPLQQESLFPKINSLPFQEIHLQVRGVTGTMINPVCGFYKIFLIGLKNIFNVLLRIAVEQREPAALDLDLNFVPLFKSV